MVGPFRLILCIRALEFIHVQQEQSLVIKMLLPAAIASLIALSSAQAVPVSAPAEGARGATAPALTLIDDRSDRRNDVRRGYDRRSQYTPGRRYKSAPSGWNRYDRRPGDWRSRRCIMVGPIWFCP